MRLPVAELENMRSQIATASRRNVRFPPYVFTKFIETAATIKTDKQLIVYSSNNLPDSIEFDKKEKGFINFGGKSIRVYNCSEAIERLAFAKSTINSYGGKVNTGEINIETHETANTATGGSSAGNVNSNNSDSNIATGSGSAGNTTIESPPKDHWVKIIVLGVIGSLIAAAIWYYFFKK